MKKRIQVGRPNQKTKVDNNRKALGGFGVRVGYATAAAAEISGDAAISCGLPSGSRALILSDGMGKGIKAAAGSRLVVNRLRKNLKEGMAVAKAIKEVNKYMIDHAVEPRHKAGANQRTGTCLSANAGRSACSEASLRTTGADHDVHADAGTELDVHAGTELDADTGRNTTAGAERGTGHGTHGHIGAGSVAHAGHDADADTDHGTHCRASHDADTGRNTTAGAERGTGHGTTAGTDLDVDTGHGTTAGNGLSANATPAPAPATTPDAETFATVDLTIIDRKLCRAKFYKMGAATSFIVRGSRVRRIAKAALPVGIIPALKLTHISAQLKAGDIIVMVSDGITDADRNDLEANWLSSYLSNCVEKIAPNQGKINPNQGKIAPNQEKIGTPAGLASYESSRRPAADIMSVASPRTLAADILREARQKYGTRERDDLTVAVAIIIDNEKNYEEENFKNNQRT